MERIQTFAVLTIGIVMLIVSIGAARHVALLTQAAAPVEKRVVVAAPVLPAVALADKWAR
ncbi:hypothetical protein BH10PSE17_BH10PSE17_10180 [soil metagenome]